MASFLLCMASVSQGVYLGNPQNTGTTPAAHIQLMADKLREQVQGGPGPTVEVKENIDKMINLIDERLVTFVIAGAHHSQANIDRALRLLQKDTTDTSYYKTTVGQAYAGAANCYRGQRRTVGTIEECAGNMSHTNTNMKGKCSEASGIRHCKWGVPGDAYGKKYCNFTDCYGGDYSVSSCGDYSTLSGEYGNLGGYVYGQYSNWFAADDQCRHGQYELSFYQHAMAGYHNQYQTGFKTCMEFDALVKKLKCDMFAFACREKCRDFFELKHNNHTIADAERVSEWEALNRIKCLLKSYTEFGEFNRTAEVVCNGGLDFSPIHINYYNSEVADLNGQNECDCNSVGHRVPILFADGVKVSHGPTSEDFVETTESEMLSVDEGEAAFPDCGVDTVYNHETPLFPVYDLPPYLGSY
jgi:hypothetical protein